MYLLDAFQSFFCFFLIKSESPFANLCTPAVRFSLRPDGPCPLPPCQLCVTFLDGSDTERTSKVNSVTDRVTNRGQPRRSPFLCPGLCLVFREGNRWEGRGGGGTSLALQINRCSQRVERHCSLCSRWGHQSLTGGLGVSAAAQMGKEKLSPQSIEETEAARGASLGHRNP